MRIETLRSRFALLAMSLAFASTACDRAQLLAPTNSTITLISSSRVLPTGGTASLSAFVSEQSGTPVQNGTTVRFTTTLGRVDPVEAQTRNGIATATFMAGDASGIAEVRAISGGATGGTTGGTGGTGSTSSSANVVQITVGAAAVEAITLRANPASVGPGGGSVELIAQVVAADGRGLDGIAVTFNADQGALNAPRVITDSTGEARTVLATNQQTIATATAGTKTSGNVTVTVRSAPGVTISCAPASGTGNCSALQPTGASNTATVLFTVTKATGSSNLRSARVDFGDGSSQDVGTLAGPATLTHSYNGPSGSNPATYSAVVNATDINGESTSASVTVGVVPRQPLAVNLAATLGTAVVGKAQSASFTATVTPAVGGADVAKSFTWDFGDNNTATTSGGATTHVYTTQGTMRVTVTVETTDGRTATGRVDLFIAF